jgi:hypothetical protein
MLRPLARSCAEQPEARAQAGEHDRNHIGGCLESERAIQIALANFAQQKHARFHDRRESGGRWPNTQADETS